MAAVHRDDAVILIKDVDFYRGGGTRKILSNINMQVNRGQICAVMGPSGVGKSTVLKLVTGQLAPARGQILVNGQAVSSMSPKRLNVFRRNIGVLLQNGALFTDLDCFENVALPLREHTGLPEALIKRLVLLKLQAVGLRGAAHLMPAELSGGMRRRVALARAIVLDPDIILYDEPLSGLDPIAIGVVSRLMRQLSQALGLTSVIVTHNVEEMRSLADYVYILIEGTVAAHGTPRQLDASTDPRIQQFMAGQADGPVPFHYPASDLSNAILQGGV